MRLSGRALKAGTKIKTPVTNARSGDRHHSATDMDLLVHPLDALEEDHLRLRTECVTLDRLSDDDLTELRSAMFQRRPAELRDNRI